MSYSRRQFGLFAGAAAALSACGFTPAYGPSGAAARLQVRMAMDVPQNRNEFDLVRQLEQRLGHTTTPTYQLSYDISTRQDGVGVTPEQEIIRFNIVGDVRYTLTDVATGTVLTTGRVDTFTGYSAGAVDVTATPPSTNATIATLAAQRDARARLMVALADQIVTQLVAGSPDWLK